MKYKFILFALLLLAANLVQAQTDGRTISETYLLPGNELKVDSLSKDPDKWDNLLDFLEKEKTIRDTRIGKWLNDLNLKFKTFQNQDSTKSSLGLNYHLTIERASIKEKGSLKNGRSIALESGGNISFSKKVNPYNFLQSKVSLNLFHAGGGVFLKPTNHDLAYYANLRRKLAMYESTKEILNSAEWKEMNEAFVLKNSWVIKYDFNAGIESNQDFSMIQNTFGIRFGAGLKSWDKNSLASSLNLIDYPFQLIRKITRYNGTIHPGVTIPSLLAGVDLVNPVDDEIREKIEPGSKPYPRANLEVGFRTILTEVTNQTLYLNSSYKYFTEIGASSNIRRNHYNNFSYFTVSLVTSSGFYTSYCYGKLPFDRQNDAVYEIGFKYKVD